MYDLNRFSLVPKPCYSDVTVILLGATRLLLPFSAQKVPPSPGIVLVCGELETSRMNFDLFLKADME